MKDRFKFRFWHTPSKKMLDCYGFNEHYTFADTLDGIGTEYNPCKTSDCVLMQCTGLRDKNGKLIYEGDIIRVQYIGAQIPLFSHQFSNLPEDEIFSIIYDYDWHKFCCKNPNYKKACEIHSLDLNAIQINTENKQYEIIGNIYENPELLEEK